MGNIPPNEVSIDLLRSLFDCDFDSGVITHKKARPGVQLGDVAGWVQKDRYRRVRCSGMTFAAHRVVWAMYYGQWPGDILDHKDGNRNNNAISNLRAADPAGNAANRAKSDGKSSCLKGVTLHKELGKWQAQIKKGSTSLYLGLFSTEEEAHAAYAEKAKELFGQFARAA